MWAGPLRNASLGSTPYYRSPRFRSSKMELVLDDAVVWLESRYSNVRSDIDNNRARLATVQMAHCRSQQQHKRFRGSETSRIHIPTFTCVNSGSASSITDATFERELQYKRSSGSGSVMGNNMVAAATQYWWQQQCRKEMLQRQSNMQLDSVARAHSLLRGSVSFLWHRM